MGNKVDELCADFSHSRHGDGNRQQSLFGRNTTLIFQLRVA